MHKKIGSGCLWMALHDKQSTEHEICGNLRHIFSLKISNWLLLYYASNELVSAFDTATQSKHYVVVHRYYANMRGEKKRKHVAMCVACVVNFPD